MLYLLRYAKCEHEAAVHRKPSVNFIPFTSPCTYYSIYFTVLEYCGVITEVRWTARRKQVVNEKNEGEMALSLPELEHKQDPVQFDRSKNAQSITTVNWKCRCSTYS
jgi:hypothetical protein